jgi:large subunit ribosomal protein L24
MSSSIKRGSEVVVIAGAHQAKRGKILEILKKKDRVVIEGVNLVKKHTKAQQNQEGGIIEREGSIHISNVMLAEKYEQKLARRK